jgi:hypothetical protein
MGEADPITHPSLYKIALGRRFAPAEIGVLEASRPPIGKFQAGRHRAARSWAHSSIGLFSRCRYQPGLWYVAQNGEEEHPAQPLARAISRGTRPADIHGRPYVE